MRKCTFLLPLHDNNGRPFPVRYGNKIKRELADTFGGYSIMGRCDGCCIMADGSLARDTTEIIVVCVPDYPSVDLLRKLVSGYAETLEQESIYFEVSSAVVEFVAPPATEARRYKIDKLEHAAIEACSVALPNDQVTE